MSFWRIIKQGVSSFITLNPSSQYLDEQWQGAQTQVSSSGAWSHDSGDVPLWVIPLTGSGNNGDYFEYEVTENVGVDRSCYVTIWLSANHSVSQ